MLGLVLAAVGLFGVLAYMVERRTGEIGVRMALGADRGRVVGMVLAGAFWQVSVGLGIGIPAAIGAGKLMFGATINFVRREYPVKQGSIRPTVIDVSTIQRYRLTQLCAGTNST